MSNSNSFFQKQLPIPKWLSPLLGSETRSVRRAGAVAGLMEGIAISRYEILMGDLSFVPMLQALLFTIVNTLLSVVLWQLIGSLMAKLLKRPDLVFRVCFALWAAMVIVGRDLLHDRSVDWGLTVWLIGLVAVALAPLNKRGKVWSWFNPIVEVVAVGLVTSVSLAGRVPDYSYPLGDTIGLFTTSFAAAAVIYVAALRMQPMLALATVLLLSLGFLPAAVQRPLDKPNVLFVLVDTLRADHVSIYGDQVESPAIEQLAAEGTVFENTVTVIPKTTSSVASFFTSLYPIHHGVRTLYSRLRDRHSTLAENFYASGYHTAAFVNNAWLSRGRGFDQGFERFHDHYEIEGAYGAFRYVSWVVFFDQLTTKTIEGFGGQTSARKLTDRALDYIRSKKDEPFFAYVHYFQPHWPYFPSAERAEHYQAPPDGKCIVNYIENSGISRGLMIFQNFLPQQENENARRLYRAECDDTLSEVGRLFEGLDQLGLKENTIVVFTADHGHSVGEHDYYFHHGEFLYDPSMKIPLVMRWPRALPAGQKIKGLVRSIDVGPTLYQLAGVKPSVRLDGASLVGTLQNPDAVGRDAFLESDVSMFADNTRRGLSGIPGKLRALRTDDYKLILNPSHTGSQFELYDLRTDPTETNNLAGQPQHTQTLALLKSRLLQYIPRAELKRLAGMGSGFGAAPTPTQQPPAQPGDTGVAAESPEEVKTDLSESEVQMLRNLGYIQ